MNCKAWLIRSLAQIGNFSETLRYGEEAIQTATERDWPLSIVFAYYAVGAVALIQANSIAIAALEHGSKVCEASKISTTAWSFQLKAATPRSLVGFDDAAAFGEQRES